MLTRPKFILLEIFVLAIGLGLAAYLFTTPEAQAPVFSRDQVTIEHTDGKTDVFDVELALTNEQHAHGLMFRRAMPQNAGMLFVFQTPGEASFWMKNTFIPLDMLFVRQDGMIVKIAANTRPHDLTHIPSGEPVAGVLEINGGEAERRGVKVGDKVIRKR